MEEWIDGLIGEPARKVLEQVGHAAMAAVPAGGVSFLLLKMGSSRLASALVGGFTGLAAGLVREVIQNWGDGRDEKTLFMIADLPVNVNMLQDIGGYTVGTALAAVLVSLLVSRR